MPTRCIYCMRADRPFKGEEHVVSQLLGRFNPDLFLKVVCDICNSKTISKLETIFKEDSMEGLIAAQYRCKTSSSIRFRNHRLKANFRVSGKESMFSHIFPCIDAETGQVVLVPHIFVEGRNGKKQVLFLKGVQDAKNFEERIGWTGEAKQAANPICSHERARRSSCEINHARTLAATAAE